MSKPRKAPIEQFAIAYECWRLTDPARATHKAGEELGLSFTTSHRYIAEARTLGIVELSTEHRPMTARWCSAEMALPSWVACLQCHDPWPCGLYLWAISEKAREAAGTSIGAYLRALEDQLLVALHGPDHGLIEETHR